MLGKSFAIMCIIAVLFGNISGNGEKLGTRAIDGAAEAVSVQNHFAVLCASGRV